MATAVGTDIMPREPASLPALRAAEHTDHPGCGPAIATVSLLSEWPIHLAPPTAGPTCRPPERPACLTMTNPSRHVWTHQIKRDHARPRHERRLSLTFNTVLIQDGIND